MTGKLIISEAATRHLDLWADLLQRGELAIQQLPPALQQYVSIGWAEAHLMAVAQARDYEHQLDRMALALLNPKDRAAEYQRRLDQHFRLEEQRFFAAEEESNNDSNNTRTAYAHHHQRAA